MFNKLLLQKSSAFNILYLTTGFILPFAFSANQSYTILDKTKLTANTNIKGKCRPRHVI